MITINSENLNVSNCPGCGEPTINLIRSLDENGRTIGAYRASLGGCHSGNDLQVQLVITLGERQASIAFAMVLWADSTDFHFSVVDANESVLRHVPSLVELLSRRDALAHPRITEVYHVADHILFDDQVIREFFGVTGNAMPCRLCAH